MDRRHRRDGLRPGPRAGCPHLVARDLARRTLAVPDDLPLAEAVRRAQRGRRPAASSPSPAAAARSAWSTRPRCWPRPRTAGRGWRSPPSPAASTTGLRLPVDITGEELVRAISRTPAAEYLLVEDDGSVYGVLTTADVDRAFRAVRD